MTKARSAQEEFVFVIRAASLWQIGYFQGFASDYHKYSRLMELLKNAEFKKRIEVESDPTYKQIIPYVILVHHSEVFSYCRGKLLNEERLLGNYSIGIGGHISVYDLNLFNVPYEVAMQREVCEEVDISSQYTDRIVGLINDDTNDVGRVHLGIVHAFNLQERQVMAKEKSINEAQFRSVEQLAKEIDMYENWSQICINNINKIIVTATVD